LTARRSASDWSSQARRATVLGPRGRASSTTTSPTSTSACAPASGMPSSCCGSYGTAATPADTRS
jgi:hypothetical protein